MCGIAGFINFSDEELQEVNACNIQQHRGPDSQKEWKHNNVVLSHQRLSIIDLNKRSDQPLIKDGLAIIFNGEIYNYQELKESLLKEDSTINFITTSDTEVLLELYRQKKEACLDDVVGMFAFAIYEMANGKLFIARDHFGIKPIFYTQIGNAFAFSSELKTLIRLPNFNKNINEVSLVACINYLWVPGNETMFQECFKLPPANYFSIIVNQATLVIKKTCYWQLDTTIKYTSERAATKALATCIQKSIDRHMVADVPVSSFLSGGLDSSLISVLAARKNADFSTYTIGITEKDKKVENMSEDISSARKVAAEFELKHHEIIIDSNIIDLLPKMVYSLDEPIGDPAALNTFLICSSARKEGVKVLLSGMGADEIFFGYRRHHATLLASKYKKIPKILRKITSSTVGSLPVKLMGRGIKISRWSKRFLSFAELPIEEAYMQSYSYYNQKELQQLFVKDIKSHYEKLRQNHADLFNEHYNGDDINKMCYTDIYMFMQGLNLTYTDRSSMAASVEVRVPFIDRQVVQMAMQIQGKLKYRSNQPKYILKKVAEKYLQKEIIYRSKAGFGAPIKAWISGELKEMVDDLLSKENVEKRDIFNYSYVNDLISNDRRGIEDNAYRIYQLLTLELWFRTFVDSNKCEFLNQTLTPPAIE
jgi:asparagine synthase (glutamine-hydrolysing)